MCVFVFVFPLSVLTLSPFSLFVFLLSYLLSLSIYLPLPPSLSLPLSVSISPSPTSLFPISLPVFRLYHTYISFFFSSKNCAYCVSAQDGSKEGVEGEEAPLKYGDSMDADADSVPAEAAAAGGGEEAAASKADPAAAAETPSPMETDEVEQLA